MTFCDGIPKTTAATNSGVTFEEKLDAMNLAKYFFIIILVSFCKRTTFLCIVILAPSNNNNNNMRIKIRQYFLPPRLAYRQVSSLERKRTSRSC